VRLEGLDRRLAAKTFGGDPTLLETVTHHDAASNSTTHAQMLLAFPNPPLEGSSKDEGTADEVVEYLEPPGGEGLQPIKPLRGLQTGRLLALIAGSHEAACATSAERQSVTGLMVDRVVSLRCP
jgi:hypothetical protein